MSQNTLPDQNTEPDRVPSYIRLTVGMASLAALGASLMLALLGGIIFGNFNLANNAHLGILTATFLAPICVVGCGLFFQVRPSGFSAALVLISYGITGSTWYLWSIPAARGLIH